MESQMRNRVAVINRATTFVHIMNSIRAVNRM